MDTPKLLTELTELWDISRLAGHKREMKKIQQMIARNFSPEAMSEFIAHINEVKEATG